MQLLVDAKGAAAPAKAQPTITTHDDIPAPAVMRGYNIDDALERTFGDAGNYEAILQANPQLRGR
jgi:hypothetical protein